MGQGLGARRSGAGTGSPAARTSGVKGQASSLLLVALVLATAPAHAQEIVFDDPAGDDTGPGTYAVPAVEGFRNGSFDLRSVRLTPEATGVRIRVTFQGAPEMVTIRPHVDSPGRPAFMPVVDLYVASHPAPGSGHRELLPGRRVKPAGEFGWDRAVVLTAVPDLMETHFARASPLLAEDTCFPRGASITGKTLDVHVPSRCLPKDLASAGFLIVVTGLGPGAGFSDLVRRTILERGPDSPDAFVREVHESVGVCNVWEDGAGTTPCSFGGCDPCEWAPFVIDAVVPPDADQAELLRAYDARLKKLAALPFVFPSGHAPDLGPPPVPDPRWPIAGVRGREMTVKTAQEADRKRFPAGTLGAIICPGEQPGGSVVVKGEAAGFVVIEKVGDDTPPCEGGVVIF